MSAYTRRQQIWKDLEILAPCPFYPGIEGLTDAV